RDARYVAGCLEGIGIDLALGLIAAAPVLIGHVAGDVLAGMLGAALFFANATGAHFHAVFLHLPTRDDFEFLKDLKVLESSLREHAPLGELVFEVTAPVV